MENEIRLLSEKNQCDQRCQRYGFHICYAYPKSPEKVHFLMRMKKLLLLLLLVGLAGCADTTRIADINKDPGHYAGRDVTIAGQTSDSFGALGNGIFQINDSTGSMWVYSQSFGVPTDGAKIAVTGRIQQGFSFGGRAFAVILKETKARH